jgi:Ferritin-like domain
MRLSAQIRWLRGALLRLGDTVVSTEVSTSVSTSVSRAQLLRRGAGGALLLATFGAPTANAAAPDVDLSYLRLLVGGELLKGDFETKALASGKLSSSASALVKRMQADDRAHYAGLSALLAGEGQSATTAEDIDFSYPRGSFGSQGAIAKLAWKLGTLTVGAYLGAIESVQTAKLRLPLGQIAANEAQQLSEIGRLLGRPPIGRAFAPALPIDAVSAALDAYES